MTSPRTYRPALSLREALAEVREYAGSQFDPTVVRTFLAAWAAGDLDRLLPDQRLSA
jgi:HD-GYP domain-containing protein (c-di-GMP phosphodiesterase class II)